jgi:hypothetical protein
MEWLSIVPLLLSLTASGLVCFLFVELYRLPHDDYHGVGAAIGIGMFSMSALVLYAIANIFVLCSFLHLDYPNSPKGLVSKILYRSATVFALIWGLLFVFLF